MTREISNTAKSGSHSDATAILQEFFRQSRENRKEQVWADHAAGVVNIYKRFLKNGGDEVIEFGDLRYLNSSGRYSRFNARLYRSASKPTGYRVRFMADGLEGYSICGRKVIFESSGDGMVMVEADRQFFANAEGVNFQDYLTRCRVRKIQTLRKHQKTPLN